MPPDRIHRRRPRSDRVDAAKRCLTRHPRKGLNGLACCSPVAIPASHCQGIAPGPPCRARGRSAVGLCRAGGLRRGVGDAGHAFPAIALARALRGRGHEVVVETWERWRDAVEGEGLAFTAAEEYTTFPPSRGDSGTWRSAADAAIALLPLMEDFRPDVVVSDILTLAPTLAAERVGVNRATLIPPRVSGPRARPAVLRVRDAAAATPVGRACGGGGRCSRGLRRGRDEMNETRAAVAATTRIFTAGSAASWRWSPRSRSTDYPRRWPAGARDRADAVRAAVSRHRVAGGISRWCWWRRAPRRIELRLRTAPGRLPRSPCQVVPRQSTRSGSVPAAPGTRWGRLARTRG
jgi:hypothetical protein